jgi:glycogen synthase
MALQVALARGAQVVVLGSASETEVHNMFERMAAEYGTGGDARFVLRYDEGLAHR